MLTKAVYWQIIVTNPVDRVQPPKAPKPKRECYDEVQTRILIDNLEKLTGNVVKYKVAVLLDIFIGARLGELAGLEWSDIDLKNGIISINKSSQYLPKALKQKVQFEKSLFPILSFLYLRNNKVMVRRAKIDCR